MSQFVRIIGGLLIVPHLLRHLGVDRYGFVSLVVSLLAIFSVVEGMLTPILRNELVKARNSNEAPALQQLISVGMSASVLLLSTAPILFALAALVDWAPLLGVPPDMPVISAILITIGVGLLGAAAAFVDCVHAAWNDLARLRLYEAVAVTCGFVCVVVLASVGAPLAWIILAMSVPVPVGRIIAFVRFVRREAILPHIDVGGTLQFFWSHRGASASFVVTQALSCVASLFPLLLISRTQGLPEISIYTVTQRLIGAPGNVILAVLPVFWPQIARAMERGEQDWLARTLWRALAVMAIGTAVAAGVVYVVGPWFVAVWTRHALTIPAAFLALFAVVSGTQVIHGWLSTFLNGLGDFHFQLACYLSFTLGCVAFGTAGLILFGLEGLALSLAAATLLLAIVPMAMRVHRRIGHL